MQPQSDTLHSIIVTLTPTRESSVRASMGFQAHAAFLKTVRESDPALAEVLHMPDMPTRPFTVSTLYGGDMYPRTPRARNGRLHLSPEETYWLRFTTLIEPIFERFMARFLHGQGRPVVRLGHAVLLIKEIIATPEGHPWAGYTSWGDLVREARPDDEIVLNFVSPTAFGFGQQDWGKKVMVLPLPETVFGSLARSWNHLAPAPFRLDRKVLREYLDEHVVIKRIDDLNTQIFRHRRAYHVGFVGRVTYGLMADDPAIRAQLNALADLALYAGVGMKTTMGMGQCRRMENGE
jgi:CRISPR-associated endoribonuclease Cas6